MNNVWTLMALVVLIASGCARWKDSSKYENAVFAEDGEAVAAVYSEYEGKNRFTYIEERRHRSRVMVADSSDGALRMLSGFREGRVIDLFYMRHQGYIILGRQTDRVDLEGGDEGAEIYYDKIALDGTVTPLGGGFHTVMLSCDGGTSKASVSPPLRVVPSPDGAILARFEATTTCQARSHRVNFLDAATLEVVDGPYELGDFGFEMSEMGRFWNTIDMAWTVEGDFAVGSWGSGNAIDQLRATVLMGEGETRTQSMGYGCFAPSTSSSHVRPNGEAIYVNPETGGLLLNEGPNSPYFGCESW